MSKKQVFNIEQKEQLFFVTAYTHAEAALSAVRELYPDVKGLTARRVTGEPGLSGVFQGYTQLKNGGYSAHGDNFHVGGGNDFRDS